ncbi:MAG: hypothetical protein KDI79_14450 [Anaerolineae bacterium]|nr:hypothetical protein [Anaerolineae bacterium]
MDDLTLLRMFEPVVKFTHGELFFPCAVDEYVRRCGLWLRSDKGREQQLIPTGHLTAERLAQYAAVPPGQTLYLRFVDEPLDPLQYQRWLARPDKPVFRAPGRLTRVGILSRIIDSLFSLSLIVRGRVPGGTAAAADVQYRAMQQQDPRCAYHGRVIRAGGYIVLQYLFFYAMNDWRSGFYGANDHESDWEQIFVYLSDDTAGEPTPLWVAYASHDFHGDDLRRRWDDPELQKVDDRHPVVFAGAGSHASYFQAGEYLMSVEPPFLRPLKVGLVALRKFWIEQLKQGSTDQVAEEVGALLSIPFVDYARGDGRAIGPGQDYTWSPVLLTKETAWAENYRGLWGLDTKDPFGGERAPAGPKYNRDGSIRTSWYDPLGWAGLDKVPPPEVAVEQLRQQIALLDQQRAALDEEIAHKRADVRRLSLEVQALHETSYFKEIHKAQQEQLNIAESDLHQLQRRAVELTETKLASQAYLAKIDQGNWGDPQAHLHHKHPPEPPLDHQARLTELWAAVSGGLLLLAFTIAFIINPGRWFVWIIAIAVAFAAIEATVRGRLSHFLLNTTIILAVITSLILIKEFWYLLFILGLFALVFTMIAENLRELWRR